MGVNMRACVCAVVAVLLVSGTAWAGRHQSVKHGIEVGTNDGAVVSDDETFVLVDYPSTGLQVRVYPLGPLEEEAIGAVLTKVATSTATPTTTATMTPDGVGLIGIAVTVDGKAFRGFMAAQSKGPGGSVMSLALVPAASFNDHIATWAIEMARTTTLLVKAPPPAAIGPPASLSAPTAEPAPASPAPPPPPVASTGGTNVNAAKAAFDGFYVQSADGFLQPVNLAFASSRLKIEETGRRARCKRNPDGKGCDFDPFICGNGDAQILELQARVMAEGHVRFVAALGVDRVNAHVAVDVKKQRGGFVVDEVNCAP